MSFNFKFKLVGLDLSQRGLDLSRRGLDRDSRSRQQKKVSLDGQENLDSFKKLALTIEISQFCLDTTFQSQKSQSRSRNLSRNLDLDWSRLSRPPRLLKTHTTYIKNMLMKKKKFLIMIRRQTSVFGSILNQNFGQN